MAKDKTVKCPLCKNELVLEPAPAGGSQIAKCNCRGSLVAVIEIMPDEKAGEAETASQKGESK